MMMMMMMMMMNSNNFDHYLTWASPQVKRTRKQEKNNSLSTVKSVLAVKEHFIHWRLCVSFSSEQQQAESPAQASSSSTSQPRGIQIQQQQNSAAEETASMASSLGSRYVVLSGYVKLNYSFIFFSISVTALPNPCQPSTIPRTRY